MMSSIHCVSLPTGFIKLRVWTVWIGSIGSILVLFTIYHGELRSRLKECRDGEGGNWVPS